MKIMLRLLSAGLSVAALLVAGLAQAQTYYARTTGGSTTNWSQNTTWSTANCTGAAAAGIPGAGNPVQICNGKTVNVNIAGAQSAALTFVNGNANSTLNLNSGSTLTVNGNATISASANNTARTVALSNGATLTVTGALTLDSNTGTNRDTNLAVTDATVIVNGNLVLQECNATSVATVALAGGTAPSLSVGGAITLNASCVLDNANGTISVGGNFTHSGTYSTSQGTFRFNGAGAQSLLGTATTTTFYNLTLAKSGGDVTLGHNADLATNGTLTLTQGRVVTAANRLYVGQGGTISGGGTLSYVAGNLLRYVGGGNQTLSWPVGGTDAASYSPVSYDFNNVSTPGNVQVTASLAAGDHPNIATSTLDSSRSLNRYWTVTNVTPIAFNSASATFSYQSADVDSGVVQTGFAAGRYSGGTWTDPDTGTASAGSLQVTGLDATTIAGAFALAERLPYSLWLMNEASWNGTANEVVDAAAAANHGTAASLGGGTPSTAGGPPATCRYGSFTRSRKDYVALPGGYPNLSTSSFSITAWIRTTDRTQPNQRIFVDDQNNAGGWGFSLGEGGAGTLRFFSRGSSTLIVDTAAVVANSAWYFVAASVRIVGTTTTVNLYVYDYGGVLVGSGSTTAGGFTWGADAGPPSIGGETNAAVGEATAAFGFSGDLDQIRVYRSALTASQVDAVRQAFTPCITINHFAITGNATGVTCSPESVTITAHDAAHAAVLYTGAVTVSTSSLRGDWTQVSGGSGFSNGAADDGVATINFVNESSVVLSLRHTYAGTSNINVVSGAIVESEDLSITWAHAGFVFTDGSAQNLANQTAGVTSPVYLLRSVQSTGCVPGGTCVGACAANPDFESGASKSVDLAFECENPSACAGGTLTFTNNGASAISANDDVAGIDNITSWTSKSLTWGANATASFTFAYSDVGLLKLHARYALSPSGEYVKGSSAAFVVKPFGFTVTGITRSDNSANPAAANASGASFVKAGEAFKLAVTAVNQSGTATPNYGKETPAEGVTLTASLVPGLGLTDNPALSNNTIAGGSFSAGVAAVSNVSWGEVGIITLSPAVADSDYLGAGQVTGTASGNIGRFVPDRLTLLGSPSPALVNRVAAACAPASAFSYMGEALGLEFTLEAQNAAGARTRNYRSSGVAAQNFAKLDFSNSTQFGFGAISGITNLTTRVAEGVSTPLRYFVNYPTWVDGQGAAATGPNTQARLRVQRNNSGPTPQDNPDGPYLGTQIGIRASDADGITLSVPDLDLIAGGGNDHKSLGVTTDLRFGRLRCQNASGSDKLALPMFFEAQHWNGAAFIRNADDSCTTVSSGDVSYSGYRNLLQAGEVGSPTVTPIAAGLGRLLLPKPAGGDGNYVGGLNVLFDLSTAGYGHLLGNWATADGDSVATTAYDDNPSCSATFGLYGSQPRQFIFYRENY